MKRIIALSAVLAMSGCAGTHDYAQSDFTYQDISRYGTVGIRAASLISGKTLEVIGICSEEAPYYSIRQTSTALYGADGNKWIVTGVADQPMISEARLNDESIDVALRSLDAVRPLTSFSGERRIQIAGAPLLRLPEACRVMHKQLTAKASNIEDKAAKENERLINDVVARTGVQPMLTGRNQVDFNNLMTLLQGNGLSSYQGKFVWAQDGDYRVAQVLKGRVMLISMTNPGLFPTITILTDKTVIEGQLWSSASAGPLQLVGVENYMTALGVDRQTVVLKQI